MDWILNVDNRILDFIAENLRTPFGDALMPLVTMLGNMGILWILIGGVLLFLPKWRWAGIEMLLALLVTVLIGNVLLKPLIARVRPFTANGVAELLIAAPTDFSFPSGHTSSSFAAATVLVLRQKRWGLAALALTGLIAFSRLYLYVHYPSDVLAGALLGIGVGIGVVKLLDWGRKRVGIVNKS